MTLCIMTPTLRERLEWSRMAQDAYRAGRNFYGHRYSVAATWSSVRIDVFDTLQHTYRRWLIGGWLEVEQPD
jgi:hypothetical protein